MLGIYQQKMKFCFVKDENQSEIFDIFIDDDRKGSYWTNRQ